MDCYLAIDVGGTTTEATLFDTAGTVVSTATQPGRVMMRRPAWRERDMEEVWITTASAVRECLKVRNVVVRAVAVVGHSDGLYPIDADGTPVSNAIQATDTRAADRIARYREGEEGDRILRLTGTRPFAGSPASICNWLLENDPAVLSEARWLLFAKDWIRYQLTGQIATDTTDAASSFLDVKTSSYSESALDLFGLTEIAELLPPVRSSIEVAGTVSEAAATATGLEAGVTVIIGCHDVDAAAIGLGAITVGQLSVVAGTFSINQVVTDQVLVGDHWQVRSFVDPGKWLAMSTSPTSASNLGWFAEMVGAGYGELLDEVDEIQDDPSEILFLPYVFGAPDVEARAGFAGIGSHHERGHLTRAVMEGVVLSHRLHLDWLSESYVLPEVALMTGGATRSAGWMQMFADGLRRSLRVGDGHETARGAAMLAAVGLGDSENLDAAVLRMSHVGSGYEPQSERADEFDRLYERFLEARQLL